MNPTLKYQNKYVSTDKLQGYLNVLLISQNYQKTKGLLTLQQNIVQQLSKYFFITTRAIGGPGGSYAPTIIHAKL